MFAWLTENLATIIISLLLFGIVCLIIYRLIKPRQSEASSCCSKCNGCYMANRCDENKQL